MYDDRRSAPRNTSLFRVEALDGTAVMIAQDISLSGMLVTSNLPRWPGKLIPVRFRPPGSERFIRATCRVHNLVEAPHGVALALIFLKLAPEAKHTISEFVGKRPLPEKTTWGEQLDGWLERLTEDSRQLLLLARA